MPHIGALDVYSHVSARVICALPCLTAALCFIQSVLRARGWCSSGAHESTFGSIENSRLCDLQVAP